MQANERTVRGGARAAKAAARVLLFALSAVCAAHARTPGGTTAAPARPVQARPSATPSPAASAGAKIPVSLNGLLKSLAAGGVKPAELIREVEARGVAFEMTDENEAGLRGAGAGAALLEAARKNYRGPVDLQELQAMLYLSTLRPPRFAAAEMVENVEKRGVNFSPTRGEEARLLKAGATRQTLAAVRANYRPDKSAASKPPAREPPFRDERPDEPGAGGGGIGSGSGGIGSGGGIGVGVGHGGAGAGEGKPTVDAPAGGRCPAGADPSADEHPYKGNEVTKRYKILARPAPNMTEEARRNQVNGTVRLRVLLSATCSVTKVEVASGLPDGLTEQAVAAAKRIRFVPSEKDGRPVSQWVLVEYTFMTY